MKKEDLSGFIVYLLIVALSLVFCFTVLREHSTASGMNGFQYWLYIAGAVVTGVVFNAILFELAHLLGAKIGRYQVLSVSILGLTFAKIDGKMKVKFKSFDGLTGETKIIPKADAKKEPNPRPFLLLGSLFFALEIIAVVFVFALLYKVENTFISNVAYFLLTVGVVGGAILLYNIIPFRLDSMTDGYRLTMISNPKNKVAFNELLRVEYEISKGNNDIEIKTFETITNFTADLNLNKVYILLDKNEFEEAEKLLDGILSNQNNVSYKTYIRAKAQKIYLHLLHASVEEAQEYYNKNVDLREVREISSDVSMPSIRTYVLICGLVDKSHSEASRVLLQVNKAYKHVPASRKAVECQLYNAAIDKVVEVNPKWDDLVDFKLITNEENK